MKTITKIIVSSIGGLLVGGALGHLIYPDVQEKTITETVEVPVVETVTETVEVPVDNGNLDEVLETIYDNDGNIEYITEDLDDDEIEQIVDRVVFENEYEKFARDELHKQLFDELHNEVFNHVKFDKEDLTRLRIDEDVKIKDVDFDYQDITFKLTGEITHDDVEYTFKANVIFKDGEFDELTVLSVY